MALPRAKRPLNYRIPGDLYHAIFEAVGTASMCWNPRPGDAVFDSTEAEKVAVNLCLKTAKAMDALAGRADAAEARAVKAEGERDEMRHKYLRGWAKVCVHHTDEEREAVSCHCCDRAELSKARERIRTLELALLKIVAMGADMPDDSTEVEIAKRALNPTDQ
jgi:hypothetical protein